MSEAGAEEMELPTEGLPMLGSLRYQCSFNKDSGVFGFVNDRRIGDFNLGRTLGHSWRTKIKLGVHATTGSMVALKCVRRDDSTTRPSSTSTEDDATPATTTAAHVHEPLRRLEVEVQALRQLSHRHIIGFIAHQDQALYPKATTRQSLSPGKEPFVAVSMLTMELAANCDLCSLLIATGALPESFAQCLFQQLHSALVCVHDFGLCHRDVRPENILLDSSYQVKLSGFGLSAPREMEQHAPCGSLQYMAPEMAVASATKGYCGERADAWSAAVVGFLVLTGRLPFAQPLKSDCYFRLLLRDRPSFWSIWERALASAATSDNHTDHHHHHHHHQQQEEQPSPCDSPAVSTTHDNNGAPRSPPCVSEAAKAFLDCVLIPSAEDRATLRDLSAQSWLRQDALPAKAVVEWMEQYRPQQPGSLSAVESLRELGEDEESPPPTSPTSPRGTEGAPVVC